MVSDKIKKVVFWLNLSSALSHPLKLLLQPALGGICAQGSSSQNGRPPLMAEGGRKPLKNKEYQWNHSYLQMQRRDYMILDYEISHFYLSTNCFQSSAVVLE